MVCGHPAGCSKYLGRRTLILPMSRSRGLLAEVSSQEAERLADLTTAWVPARLATILDAARDRGEIGPAALSPRVQSLPLILVRHELLQSGNLNEATLADIIDTVYLPLLAIDARQTS